MNKEKPNWFNISGESLDRWKQLCPPNEYRVYSSGCAATIFNGILPSSLITKFDSIFIAGSATAGGTVYYMANGNRIDTQGGAIDQMPFGLAFVGDTPAGSACLLQHAGYTNRTTPIPHAFWNYVSGSDINSYYPLSELPTESQGKLADLKVDSQNEAFGKLIEIIKEEIDET